MNPKLMLAAAVAACTWLSPVAGQTVYRCGDSYSQQPCPDAKAVPAEDPRTAVQRRESLQATQRDAQAAHRMEEARLKEEARAPRAPADAVPAKPSAPPEENPVIVRRKKPPRHLAPTAARKAAQAQNKKSKTGGKAGSDAKDGAPKAPGKA